MVRWQEDGKQRVRRFVAEENAAAVDADVNPNGRANQRVGRVREAAQRRIASLEREAGS